MTSENDRRSISGLATTWTPPAARTLTFGFARTVYAPLSEWDQVFGHAVDVLRDRVDFKKLLAGLEAGKGKGKD